MSYLGNLRLNFFGRFQADVSTVNNDVRHFDNRMFEPRFQDLQRPVKSAPKGVTPTEFNGWWNPNGTGAFRLVGCRVTSVGYGDGTGTADPARDRAVGLHVAGSDDSVSAKIVDIDPQWQLASQIWGLQVRLVDDAGQARLSSRYQPAAFRDLWFGRTGGGGDGGASALFQSVLTDLEWGGADSRFLEELRAAAGGQLSIRLMTYWFNGSAGSSTFTLGWVAGAIGPAAAGEPHSCVLGRRMVVSAAPGGSQASQTAAGLGFFDCAVAGSTVFADFSNGLPLLLPSQGTPESPLRSAGQLQLAVLEDATLQEGDQVQPGQIVLLGTVPYLAPGWLATTSAIYAVSCDPATLAKVQSQPLAVISQIVGGPATVAIRESPAGWNVRADNFVQRADPGDVVCFDVYAAQYGVPVEGAAIAISLQPPMSGLGDTGLGAQEYKPPQADVPDIGTPATAIEAPTTVTTGAHGRAVLSVATRAPGNPRGYLDGQLYLLGYNLAAQTIPQQAFDTMLLLLFDDFAVPETPAWADVQVTLQQYANLYPIMSRYLVDLGSYADVLRHRRLLELAMSRPVTDPNYMPVTRDLSGGKREAILKWLRLQAPGKAGAALPPAAAGAAPPQSPLLAPAQPPPPAAAAAAAAEPAGGKTTFLKGLQRARDGGHHA